MISPHPDTVRYPVIPSSITGYWTVYWDTAQYPPMLDRPVWVPTCTQTI